jgi:hypothetical protein
MSSTTIRWLDKKHRIMICRVCGHWFKAPKKVKQRSNLYFGLELKYPKGTWTRCPKGCSMDDLHKIRHPDEPLKKWGVHKVCNSCPHYHNALQLKEQ